jgi:hypothetical protein
MYRNDVPSWLKAVARMYWNDLIETPSAVAGFYFEWSFVTKSTAGVWINGASFFER